MAKQEVKKRDHLHRYKRKNIGAWPKKYYVFACTMPGCEHFLSRELLVGRLIACGKCGEPFAATREATSLAVPRCLDCKQKPKERVNVSKAVAAILSSLPSLEDE